MKKNILAISAAVCLVLAQSCKKNQTLKDSEALNNYESPKL